MDYEAITTRYEHWPAHNYQTVASVKDELGADAWQAVRLADDSLTYVLWYGTAVACFTRQQLYVSGFADASLNEVRARSINETWQGTLEYVAAKGESI